MGRPAVWKFRNGCSTEWHVAAWRKPNRRGVDRAALDRLKALIFEVSGGACVAMLEARRRPLSQEGDADATSGPPSLFRPIPPALEWRQQPSDVRRKATELMARMLRERWHRGAA